MSNIQKAWEATVTATGVVAFVPAGLPAHLLPSAARNPEGPDVRVPTVQHLFVEDTPKRKLTVNLASTGSVTYQGCDGDPSVAGNWYDIGSAITSDGAVSEEILRRFVRVNVTDAGTGVTVQLVASN